MKTYAIVRTNLNTNELIYWTGEWSRDGFAIFSESQEDLKVYFANPFGLIPLLITHRDDYSAPEVVEVVCPVREEYAS